MINRDEYYLACWRDHVGPGWHSLVEPLVTEIQRLGGKIAQIKEKFGGLRFYYDLPVKTSEADREAFSKMVQEAESASDRTCEECGQPGKHVSPRGWIKTLCETHEKALKEKA